MLLDPFEGVFIKPRPIGVVGDFLFCFLILKGVPVRLLKKAEPFVALPSMDDSNG